MRILILILFVFNTMCSADGEGRYAAFTILNNPDGQPAIIARMFLSATRPMQAVPSPGEATPTPESALRRQIDLMIGKTTGNVADVFVRGAKEKDVQEFMSIIDDPETKAQVLKDDLYVIAKAYVGDACVVYGVLGATEGDQIPFFAVTCKDGNQWRIDPSASNLHPAVQMVNIQSTAVDLPIIVEQDYRWFNVDISATGAVVTYAGEPRTATTLHLGFRLEPMDPIRLDGYTGDRPEAIQWAGLIEMQRKAKTQEERNAAGAKWIRSMDTEAFDPLGLRNNTTSVIMAFQISTELGILYGIDLSGGRPIPADEVSRLFRVVLGSSDRNSIFPLFEAFWMGFTKKFSPGTPGVDYNDILGILGNDDIMAPIVRSIAGR
ncbi:MAG: hypothetical protein RLZZ127_295 [Planctomycetota bacterium]|jgi:hypothetical protein